MIGKVLGERYELLELIGEGGMSYVYKARCNKLNRYVAVKILKDSLKDNKDIVDKFKKEAMAVAMLSDANIVNVLDVGTQEDINYIVMEYVEGKTLKDIVNEKGKLPYEVAVSIALKVANGLDCAHKRGIIHRDIKPQNILVTESGVVKVTDFGIAKLNDTSTIAHTTTVMGSAHYFSPEQAKGGYVDFRTDLYSLGILLYEMVAGEVPFDGDSPVAVALKQIQEAPVPPKDLNPSIPDSLNSLILKAMEKDPIRRFQTSREFIQALEDVKNNPSVTVNNSNEDQFTRVMSPVEVPNNSHTTILKDGDRENIKKDHDMNDDYEDDDYEDDDYEDEKELIKDKKNNNGSKKKSGLIIAIVSILVILLGVGAGAVLLNKGKAQMVKVPNVISKTKEEAKKAIEEAGLVYSEQTEESKEEPGIVLRLDPKEDTEVKKGSTVKVIISKEEEKEKVTVPDLSNHDVNTAKKLLGNVGLELGSKSYNFSDTVPKDTIISQAEAANTEVEKGTKVDIVISKGPEVKMVNVPNVTDMTVDEATKALRNVNLKVNAVKGNKATEKALEGKVYSQDVSVETSVKQGTTITITYYDKYEEEKKKHDAREILRKTKSEAEAWAKERKINISFTGDQDGRVISVSAQEVEEGGSVTATLKKDEEPKPEEPKSPVES